MSVSNGSAGVAGEDMGTSRVRAWIDQARRVVVLTGAGISTDSGIPDFRGPNGVWTKNPEAEKAATIQHYLADPEVRLRAWQTRLSSPAWSAQPNAGHHALVELERRGKLHAIVTQNVDELHQRAGSTPQLVVEVHGTMFRTRCWGCEEERPMEDTLGRGRPTRPAPGAAASSSRPPSPSASRSCPRSSTAPWRWPRRLTCCWRWARRWPSTRWPTWCPGRATPV